MDAGGYQADLLVSGAPVVVDFEGPRDFLRGPGGPGDVRPVGSTVLRRRQLRWFGYEVVSAPMRNWAGRGPVGFSSKGGRGSLNSDMPLYDACLRHGPAPPPSPPPTHLHVQNCTAALLHTGVQTD